MAHFPASVLWRGPADDLWRASKDGVAKLKAYLPTAQRLPAHQMRDRRG